MKKIKDILLYLWQMPQNILGLILMAVYKPEVRLTAKNGNLVCYSKRMRGGISLGKYSIIDDWYHKGDDAKALETDVAKHEALGHGTQSRWLGPLYLLVIGLPSLVWAWIYPCRMFPYSRNGYYRFYTEKWADRLGNVKR